MLSGAFGSYSAAGWGHFGFRDSHPLNLILFFFCRVGCFSQRFLAGLYVWFGMNMDKCCECYRCFLKETLEDLLAGRGTSDTAGSGEAVAVQCMMGLTEHLGSPQNCHSHGVFLVFTLFFAGNLGCARDTLLSYKAMRVKFTKFTQTRWVADSTKETSSEHSPALEAFLCGNGSTNHPCLF